MSTVVQDQGSAGASANTAASHDQKKIARINATSTGPVRSLPMTLFMLWMVGNDIHIFSIMFVSMSITQPITSLFATGSAFAMFEDDPKLTGKLRQAKLVHAGCCLVALFVGLVKLKWMGLLPTQYADWMDHAPPQVTELSFQAF